MSGFNKANDERINFLLKKYNRSSSSSTNIDSSKLETSSVSGSQIIFNNELYNHNIPNILPIFDIVFTYSSPTEVIKNDGNSTNINIHNISNTNLVDNYGLTENIWQAFKDNKLTSVQSSSTNYSILKINDLVLNWVPDTASIAFSPSYFHNILIDCIPNTIKGQIYNIIVKALNYSLTKITLTSDAVGNWLVQSDCGIIQFFNENASFTDDNNDTYTLFENNSNSPSTYLFNKVKTPIISFYKYIGFKGTSFIKKSNFKWILPTNDGNSNQVLTTDGNGNLTFSNPSSGLISSLTNNTENKIAIFSNPTNTLKGSNLIYNDNTLFIEANTLSTSTQTGALVIKGGAGIQQNLYIGGMINSSNFNLSGTSVNAINTTFIDNNTSLMTSTAIKNKINTEITALVDSAPGALNTLNELAAALNDDTNFSTTITNQIALKAPINNPIFTGITTINNYTKSIDTLTGALIINGGVAVQQDINLGGHIILTGDINKQFPTDTTSNFTFLRTSSDISNGNGNDITLLRVNSTLLNYNYGNYGFSLDYLGSSIENSRLVFQADNNNASTQIPALTIYQDAEVYIETNLTINNSLKFLDNDKTHYVGFKSPLNLTNNNIWSLPSADGTEGQFLKTDGSGNLTFDTLISTTINVNDTTNNNCSVALFESSTGQLAPKTDSTFTYNATTGNLNVNSLNISNLNLSGTSINTINTHFVDNNTSLMTSTAIKNKINTDINALVDSAPDILNTLNELAAALNDDANFSTTIANQIALKAPIDTPILTGITTINNYTKSINTNTGALVVKGGLGIQENINIGGNITLSDVELKSVNLLLSADSYFKEEYSDNKKSVSFNHSIIQNQTSIFTLYVQFKTTDLSLNNYIIGCGENTNFIFIKWNSNKFNIGLGNITIDSNNNYNNLENTIISLIFISYGNGTGRFIINNIAETNTVNISNFSYSSTIAFYYNGGYGSEDSHSGTIYEYGLWNKIKTKISDYIKLESLTPYLSLKNIFDENIDEGCKSKILFEDHTNVPLSEIQSNHEGISNDTKGNLIFSTNNGSSLNESFRIKSNGYIGIGTTNPQQTVDINGTLRCTQIVQDSDKNIKTNIKSANINNCFNNIQKLQLKNYNFTEKYKKEKNIKKTSKQLGLIAQEVATILPDSINIIKNQQIGNQNIESFHTINMNTILMNLIGTVQLLIQKNHILEKKIQKLELKINS